MYKIFIPIPPFATGGFVFAAHLAFTVVYDASYVPAMVAGKLVGGLLALILALFISSRTLKKTEGPIH
ncbi:MAG: ethanolamine utilization protein EutH [Ruminococcaceae bacterium]|nr:ethanolamine utilization protein EutH [Oscillospiraceae bacterium]